ncbi:MAG: glycosyltransferase [Methanogenium sp.]|jgi:glycosyltransferase involved in cell wall biosynthesis
MISVVTACLNEEEMLPIYFASLSKLPKDKLKEIIIIDGGSNDKTIPIIEKASKSLPIKLIVRSDIPYVAQQKNVGIALATGKFVLPLDADETIDSLLTEKLEKLPSYSIAWQFRKWYTIQDVNHHALNHKGFPCHKIFQNGRGIRYNRKIHDHFIFPSSEYDGGALRGEMVPLGVALNIHVFDNRLLSSDEGLEKKFNIWKDRGILEQSKEEGIPIESNFWLSSKRSHLADPSTILDFPINVKECIHWTQGDIETWKV